MREGIMNNYEQATTALHLAIQDALDAALEAGFDDDDVRMEIDSYFETMDDDQ
jgi:hypothetical protein